MRGQLQDGRGGGLLQPEAGGDDQGGEEERGCNTDSCPPVYIGDGLLYLLILFLDLR